MMPTYIFPTTIAKRLMKRAKLDDVDIMREFQQLAVSYDLETALLAYVEVELGDDQLEILEIIHKSTRPWLVGHVVGEIANQMNIKPIESAQVILNRLIATGDSLPDKEIDNLLDKLLKR